MMVSKKYLLSNLPILDIVGIYLIIQGVIYIFFDCVLDLPPTTKLPTPISHSVRVPGATFLKLLHNVHAKTWFFSGNKRARNTWRKSAIEQFQHQIFRLFSVDEFKQTSITPWDPCILYI